MPYIDQTDIQATMKRSRFDGLTKETGAIAHAINTTNSEMRALLNVEFEDVADCPDNVRGQGGIVGRYHLYSFNELVDKDDSVRLDYLDAIKHLQAIGAGKEAGLDDPDDTTDDVIQSSSRTRTQDYYFDLDEDD